MLISGEQLTANLAPQERIQSIRYGVTRAWSINPVIEDFLIEGGQFIQSEIPGGLTESDLPAIGLSIFEHPQSTALQTSINFLRGGEGGFHLQHLQTSHLETGKKAYILLCDTVVDDTSYPFVIYLSRGWQGTHLDEETRADFGNLPVLANLFETRLKPFARHKYTVVRPIAIEYLPYNGRLYPFYTTPLVEDMGELYIDFCPLDIPILGPGFPWFHYALQFDNEEMRKTNEQQTERTLQLAEKIASLYRQFSPDIRAFFKRVNRIPDTLNFNAQKIDLLIGTALIYILTDGLFPQQFSINAGDYMAKIGRNWLTLKLMTTRGGLIQLGEPVNGILPPEPWMLRMQSQVEPCLEFLEPMYRKRFSPFSNLEDIVLLKVFRKAKKLVRP